jgi:hypothetical protein
MLIIIEIKEIHIHVNPQQEADMTGAECPHCNWSKQYSTNGAAARGLRAHVARCHQDMPKKSGFAR